MRFQFFPLRFEFAAQDPLYFSPGKAGNTLRGALGTIFKRIASFRSASTHAPAPRVNRASMRGYSNR